MNKQPKYSSDFVKRAVRIVSEAGSQYWSLEQAVFARQPGGVMPPVRYSDGG
jgi:hypothetical protein